MLTVAVPGNPSLLINRLSRTALLEVTGEKVWAAQISRATYICVSSPVPKSTNISPANEEDDEDDDDEEELEIELLEDDELEIEELELDTDELLRLELIANLL